MKNYFDVNVIISAMLLTLDVDAGAAAGAAGAEFRLQGGSEQTERGEGGGARYKKVSGRGEELAIY